MFFVLYLVLVICTQAACGKEQDLYKLLGVSKTATVKEIKSAYRRKALDTHPDKNKKKPPEEAAEAFRQVVHAFEILSDESSRKRYDRTGRADGNANNYNNNDGGRGRGYQQQQYDFNFQWNFYRRPQRLKDKFEVKQAMSRVLHVVSLEQLKTIMLDEDDKLERNILICFTTAQVEKHVDEEMVFPYPFAAMSSQGIWWEDLLQTVKIRFHRSNELTKFFGVTAFEIQENSEPIFFFGKRGTHVDDWFYHFTRLQTRDRKKFEEWMWKQIEIRVGFENQHDHPVEIYWIHGNTAHVKETCQPNALCWHTTMLSHEWYVRDARVDTRKDSPGRYKLTNDSSLGSWKILKDDDPQIIVIKKKTCFDLSGHCKFWQHYGECRKNPRFMGEVCQLTCNICKPDKDDDDDEDEL